MGLFSAIGGVLKSVASPLVGGALSLIGGERRNSAQMEAQQVTNQLQAMEAEKNRQFNASEAYRDRNWQEKMIRNAHQFQVQDLARAGLNPILSAKLGGSQVTGGATAQGQQAQFGTPQFQDTITPAVNTGMEIYKAELSGKQVNASVDKIRSEIKTLDKGRQLTDQQIDKLAFDMARIDYEIDYIISRTTGQDQTNKLRQVVTNIIEKWKVNETANDVGTMFDIMRGYLGKFGQGVAGKLMDLFDYGEAN